MREAVKLLNAGINFKDVLRGVNKSKEIALATLKTLQVQIEDKPDLLYKIAYSSCENKRLARLISKIFELIGVNGYVDFEEYYSSETNVIYFNGFLLDRG